MKIKKHKNSGIKNATSSPDFALRFLSFLIGAHSFEAIFALMIANAKNLSFSLI